MMSRHGYRPFSAREAKRSVTIVFRESTLTRLQPLADKQGMPVSVFIRGLIDRAVDETMPE